MRQPQLLLDEEFLRVQLPQALALSSTWAMRSARNRHSTGFADEIGGAGRQSLGDGVRLFRAGHEDDGDIRCLGPLADRRADGIAIQRGQEGVDDDQVRRDGIGQFEAVLAVFRETYLVTRFLEVFLLPACAG